MNRIDYRFYRTKKQEMVYGFPGCSTTYVLDMWENEKHVSEPMQYTGLKDMDGKKIYENDIDIDVDSGDLSVVKYLKKYGAYCFVPIELYLHENYEEEVNYEHGYDCYFHNVTPSKYACIIGNIYEHSHLLEVE